MRKKVALLFVAVFTASCAVQKKQEAYNPFSNSLQTQSSKKVSLALVFPALAFNGAKPLQAEALMSRSKSDPDKLYREPLAIYYRYFKKVTMVKSADDPRAADADLIGKIQVTMKDNPPQSGPWAMISILTGGLGAVAIPAPRSASMEFKTLFYTPEHNLVATVNTTADGKFSAPFAFTKKLSVVFDRLMAQIPDKLSENLSDSKELQRHASSLGSAMASRRENAVPQTKVFDSDVDRPAYTFKENANNYALVIGIDTYQNLPAAEYAGRDAVAVRAHLRALGYPGENTVLLLDSQATGNAMKSYLESWLPRKVKEDSKVFVYFSGHGAPDVDSKEAFLVPWDGDPQFLSDTGYSLKRFYKNLNELKAKKVIVAMDSCFSGAGGKSVIAKGARPLVAKIKTDSRSLGKVTVLAAAGGDEITGGEDSQGHGLFTYYFLKGLNDSGGKDTVGQIYENLKPKVSAAARRANRGQTPQLIGVDNDQSAAQSLR